MANQFEDVNESVAQGAVQLVRIVEPTQDAEAVANGARTASELMCRTLGRFGIELPEAFAEGLEDELAAATIHDATAMRGYHSRVAEMQAGGL